MTTHEPPAWWAELTSGPVGAELGISWLDPTSWEPADALSGEYEHTARTISVPFYEELDAERRTGKLLVGTGPSTTRRGMGYDIDAHWYLDPADPDSLWCALGGYFPAWLWIPLSARPDALREVLSGTFPRPELGRLELTALFRGYLGFRHEVEVPNVYSGEFVEVNGHDLDRYFTGVDFVEPQSWGSAHLDDPLKDDVGFVPPLQMIAASHGTKSQRLGLIPSMTWRAVHSRAYLSIEFHTRQVVCAAIRYRPTPASHRAVVARLNEVADISWPEDVPLDVIGALSGLHPSSEAGLADNLANPAALPAMVRILAALRAGDLRATLGLREFAAHPDPEVRLAVVRAAAWYNYQFLLYEVALAETDPEVLHAIERSIQLGGAGPDSYNAFGDHFDPEPVMIDDKGEPVATWSDDDEDDESDESDDEEPGRD
ncbi:MAG: HEAT repeat domain-containing protein [Actinocatenispora sp.]